jgi:hypothetical protein
MEVDYNMDFTNDFRPTFQIILYKTIVEQAFGLHTYEA